MSNLILSHATLARNRFVGKVRSSWENAFKLAQLLPKNHAPIEIIYPLQDQILFDKGHRYGNSRGKFPTDYLIRIRGKGLRRIYKGNRVYGYEWVSSLNRFCRGWSNEECGNFYYYIEVDHKIVVVITDLGAA